MFCTCSLKILQLPITSKLCSLQYFTSKCFELFYTRRCVCSILKVVIVNISFFKKKNSITKEHACANLIALLRDLIPYR